MEPQPQQPGGPVNSHPPEPGAGQSNSSNPAGVSPSAYRQPGHSAPTNVPLTGNTRTTVQPPENLKSELADKMAETTRPVQKPAVAYVPEAFQESPKAETPAPSTPQAPTVSTAALSTPVMANGSTAIAVRPSGRWQTFWYALSVLSLGLLFIATSTVTSQGTLEKLLIGLKPNPSEALFGTPWNIILGYTMLSLFVVCLPLFIVSTIVVDRYRTNHPDMRTASMKKLSYAFMVLASLLIVFQIATAVFAVLYNVFDTINAISIGVNIAFMLGYFAWLFTLVAEDRSV